MNIEQACNRTSVFLCVTGREHLKVLNSSIKAHYGQVHGYFWWF